MYMAEYMAGFLQYLQYMNTRGQGSQGDYQKHLATTSAAVLLLLLCTQQGTELAGTFMQNRDRMWELRWPWFASMF